MSIKRKCSGCRAEYIFHIGEIHICPYCGTEQSTALDNSATDLMSSAEALRRGRSFDKAREEYKRVLNIAKDCAEAYFGLFLCDYGVADEAALNGEAPSETLLTAERCAVSDNQNYSSAIMNSGRKKDEWENLAKSIEKCRCFNLAVKRAVKNNGYRVAVICDEDCHPDKVLAESIYSDLHKSIDVFYPRETLKKIPKELASAATAVAIGYIPLLFIICSEHSANSDYLKRRYSQFILSHKAYQVQIISSNEGNIPQGIEYNNELIDHRDCVEGILKRVRVIGGLSMSEKARLRNGGVCLKNEGSPSPIINKLDV